MKCPRKSCGAWSDVVETRDDRRRRQCANGHRFTTYEVVRHFRQASEHTKKAVAKARTAGESISKVAARFNVSRASVIRWSKK